VGLSANRRVQGIPLPDVPRPKSQVQLRRPHIPGALAKVQNTLRQRGSQIYFIDDGAGDHLSILDPVTMTGPALYHQYILDELNEWLFRTPWKVFRSAINFSRYSFGMGRSPLASNQGPSLRNGAVLGDAGGAIWLRDGFKGKTECVKHSADAFSPGSRQ